MQPQDRALENFSDGDKQQLMQQRIRSDAQQGMVQILNNGYPQGKKIFYPLHQFEITMPEQGDTITVPRPVGAWLMQMFNKKLSYVHSGRPANFTPPPGYKLVPVENDDTLPGPDESELLKE